MVGRTSITRRFLAFALGILVIVGLCASILQARDGMLSVSPIGPNMDLVFVVPGGTEVTGVRWYNNDDMYAFPEVSLREGYSASEYRPGEILGRWTDVRGLPSGWTTLSCNTPLSGRTGLYYVVFRLPEGATFSQAGSGGGPGIGYAASGSEPSGFVVQNEEVGLQLRGQVDVQILGSEKSVDGAGAGIRPSVTLSEPLCLTTWPNPARGRASVYYSLPRDVSFDLSILDLRGRLVRRIAGGSGVRGGCTRIWDGADDSGRRASAGVYYARLRAGTTTRTDKIVLVR